MNLVDQKKIALSELSKFGTCSGLNEQATALVLQQKSTWQLARNNYAALSGIQSRTFHFSHFKIIAQHNPGRIRSSAAKTDAASLAERPCFLCLENLPPEQKGIIFQNDFLILTNPFPIFPFHLTMSNVNHTPQKIGNYISDMLDLSRQLTGFTVFYNGPECGASAPDHFHFQAGSKGLLPIETEFEDLRKNHGQILVQQKNLQVIAVENYLRQFIAIISSDKNEAAGAFEMMYKKLPSVKSKEPMLNVLCNYENGNWHIILFPRKKQRPSHYFQEDDKKLVVSPAAVELGGVFILPREEDFLAMNSQLITEIFNEVCIEEKDFKNWIISIKK